MGIACDAAALAGSNDDPALMLTVDDTALTDLTADGPLPVSDPCNLRYTPPLAAVKCRAMLAQSNG